MNWKNVGDDIIKAGAHMLGTAVGVPGVGDALGGIIGNALGVSNPTPDNISAAIKADPQAGVKLAEIEADKTAQLEQIAANQAVALSKDATTQQGTINETMRAELATRGFFKTDWRAAIGWVMAATFLEVATAMSWAVLMDPTQMSNVISGILMLVPTMGAVVGVNIHRTTAERQTAMTGVSPPGILQSVRAAVAGK